METKVIPAILEYSEDKLHQELSLAATFAQVIHVDLIDTSFTRDIVLPSPDLLAPFAQRAFLELHMMVDNPHEQVEQYAHAGITRFIGHVEHENNIPKFVEVCKNVQAEAHLGFDLHTSLDAYLSFFSATAVSGATIMTINAGHAGQQFQSTAITKVQQLRAAFPNTIIEVDGGMNKETLPLAYKSGANHFAVNSDIFSRDDPQAEYEALTSLTQITE